MIDEKNFTELKRNYAHIIEHIRAYLIDNDSLRGIGFLGVKNDGRLFFRQNGKDSHIDIKDDDKKKTTLDYLERGWIPMALIREMMYQDEKELDIDVMFFAGQNFLGDINLIFTNKVIKQTIKNAENIPSEELDNAVLNYARKYFSLSPDDKHNLIIYTSSASDLNTADYDEIKNKPVSKLSIYGSAGILQVGLYRDENEEVMAVAQGFNRRFPSYMPPLFLGETNLSATTKKSYTSQAVGALMEQNNKYVDVWNAYARQEGNFLLKKNREIGLLGYNSEVQFASEDRDSVIVMTLNDEAKSKMNLLKVGDRLRTASKQPSFILDSEMEWDEYLNINQNDTLPPYGCYEIREMDLNRGILKLVPLGKTKLAGLTGNLFYDDYGDIVQIRRRQGAFDRIEHANSANPQLGLIIGGADNSYTMNLELCEGTKHTKKISALSNKIERKIFKNPPTKTQLEAIEIALNTPDIAVIQGPPGTGKTTVITAILERLNEMANKKELRRGEVLITSLQHDAVINVIERLRINSLPTVKFGEKKGEDTKTLDGVVDKWCADLAEKLREKNPQLRENEEFANLHHAFFIYRINPTTENAVEFLNEAASFTLLNGELVKEIAELRTIYNQKHNSGLAKDSDIIMNIRRLRTRAESFEDDGADLADALLLKLENVLNRNREEDNEILQTLEEAADCFDKEPSQDMLKRLSKCKYDLLRRIIPPPRYEKPTFDENLKILYEKMAYDVKNRGSKENEALHFLLDNLENNSLNIKETLKDYSFAFAATAQQSMSRQLLEAKFVKTGESVTYDTVIVDEAARVNPGDLMIPLSQAKRRIILVGDHRQLPHIYDEEIFEQLEKDGVDMDLENIKESMFEHLWKRAQFLTKKDNIKRAVTLNKQFRMHKELGQFVSDNFYAAHDLSEAFSSPLPDEFFAQNLEPYPMKWINVPESGGKMEQISHSKRRRKEAKVISDLISKYKTLMQEGQTIGVISFYRAQVDYIRNNLKAKGLDKDKNIMVGTVDSFQGMEFDIIILSVVRTPPDASKYSARELSQNETDFTDEKKLERFTKYKERMGRSIYGFLTSENRLCVALSRQKRLLVIVGDANLFRGKFKELAQIFVPAMRNFYKLCEGSGAVEDV